MGEHSAPENKWAAALGWALRNRRKIAAALVVALPLLARLVPGFPDDVLLDALKAYLGA
ncbi:hypothetical protein ABZ192_12665 [Streptomyces sp. NPDC006235]|uniref:hypothetical protein n=1 Tax=Streptomyces sp. NPDC006235 TaxID=3156736 RepID=UPI0033B43369